MINNKIIKPCIIGLGYVGLPIFIRLKKTMKTVGFDISKNRVDLLNQGIDNNFEYNKKSLKLSNNSILTSQIQDLKDCNFFIITVPTPITKNKKPDLKPLLDASNTLARVIKKNDIIFIESTVFPGVTEDIIGKYLEKKTSLKSNKDFFLGYSPERINPGDKKHTVEKINKVVAFNKRNVDEFKKVKTIYNKISRKLIFTNKIKEAETSKAIENIQRDLNIAFINEVFMFSEKLNLDFKEVIKLASTKWNFLNFSPGLVGGHCLPVDPYYLVHCAKSKKFSLKISLAGRVVNDDMVNFLIKKIQKTIKKNNLNYKKEKILFLGSTYKPNVADQRNSLAKKIINKFYNINKSIRFYDPYYKSSKMKSVKPSLLVSPEKILNFRIIIKLVNHLEFQKIILKIKKRNILFIDPLN